MTSFERGETVSVVDCKYEAVFLASDGDSAWIRWPLNGSHGTVPLQELRKLPPPFAVVTEGGCLFAVRIGEMRVNAFARIENAKNCADAINAAFAARLAEELAKAGKP